MKSRMCGPVSSSAACMDLVPPTICARAPMYVCCDGGRLASTFWKSLLDFAAFCRCSISTVPAGPIFDWIALVSISSVEASPFLPRFWETCTEFRPRLFISCAAWPVGFDRFPMVCRRYVAATAAGVPCAVIVAIAPRTSLRPT